MTIPARLLLGTIALSLIVALGHAQSSASSTGTEASPPFAAGGAFGMPGKMVAAATSTGNITQGKILYAEKCGICHNTGGMGPSLKGEKSRKDQAATVAWIKNPAPPMPKLFPSQLSQGDVNDVAAYVQTLAGSPVPPPSAHNRAPGTKAKTVAGASAAGTVAQGKMLYGERCASCHGATGTEGGVGPSLRDEKSRKDQAATVAWIKNPKPPMPKLYPSPLGANEVSEIAAYVETL